MATGPAVLCIDQDANHGYSLVQWVKRSGCTARLATSLPAAISAVQATMPEVVVIREHFRFDRAGLAHLCRTLRSDVPAVLLVGKRPARISRAPGLSSALVIQDSEKALRACLGTLLPEAHCVAEGAR